MSKWEARHFIGKNADVCEVLDDSMWGYVIRRIPKEIAEQVVREHNAHAELVLCLKAMLKNDCGECRGEKLGKMCYVGPDVCALSAQARSAIEAAEGRTEDEG